MALVVSVTTCLSCGTSYLRGSVCPRCYTHLTNHGPDVPVGWVCPKCGACWSPAFPGPCTCTSKPKEKV